MSNLCILSTLIAIATALVLTGAEETEVINCHLQEEKNNAYILENAWYQCLGQTQRLRYCVICDDPTSAVDGTYISIDTLKKFKQVKDRNLYSDGQLADFCNTLKAQGCDNIKNQIDGAGDSYNGGFCDRVPGTLRRWINNGLQTRQCN